MLLWGVVLGAQWKCNENPLVRTVCVFKDILQSFSQQICTLNLVAEKYGVNVEIKYERAQYTVVFSGGPGGEKVTNEHMMMVLVQEEYPCKPTT